MIFWIYTGIDYGGTWGCLAPRQKQRGIKITTQTTKMVI